MSYLSSCLYPILANSASSLLGSRQASVIVEFVEAVILAGSAVRRVGSSRLPEVHHGTQGIYLAIWR